MECAKIEGLGWLRVLANPTPEMTLEAGDVVIALGHQDQLARLRNLARS